MIGFGRTLRLTVLLLTFPFAVGHAQVDLAKVQSDMAFLTSAGLAGRNTPGPSGDSTARWVADQFKQAGLIGALPRQSYFQGLPLVAGKLDTAKTELILSLVDRAIQFRWGNGFYFFPRRIAYVHQDANPVFCGTGLEIPKAGRNDYPPTVKGRAAIVLAGGDTLNGALSSGMLAQPAFKAAAAQRAGATMLIVLYTKGWDSWVAREQGKKIADSRNKLVDLDGSTPDFPILYLDATPLMGDLLPWQDQPDSLWRSKAEPKLIEWLNGHPCGVLKATLSYRFNEPETPTSSNVVGMIPGKTDEWVILGAHYDHLGPGYPGADDNASGTVGLLELARKWGRLKETPQRGVIFVSFTCEEDGLLGSQWFAEHLPVSKDKIVAMINLDMIGRQGSGSMGAPGASTTPEKNFAAAYFSAPSPAMKDLLRSAADGVDLQTTVQPINSFRHFGDGAPFHEAGIPTVHIFSGFHADYHQPTDTPDKIDYEKLAKMIDLTDRALHNFVETSARPGFDPSIRVESGGMGY